MTRQQRFTDQARRHSGDADDELEIRLTRQQRFMDQARRNVGAMLSQPPETKTIYGGLCHKLPVLVRTNGLCQTLAFVEQKATGDDARAAAYRALREHVAQTLGLTGGGRQLLNAVQSAGLGQYVQQTRLLLQAWTYYRRFAVSILEVEAGAGEEAGS